MKRICVIVAVSCMAFASLYAQRTLPMTLEEMVKSAGTIVHAVVTDTRTGKDPVTGLAATWITLSVQEDFYGAPAQTFTFKQFGGEADGMALRIADAPSYARGQELVLLLYPAHPKTGFSSPVGMGQGMFTVKAQPAPRQKIANQETQTGMTLKKELRYASSEPLPFARLAEEIRSLVRARKQGVR